MTKERRDEIDNIIQPLTEEFKTSANTDGKFGAFYMSADSEAGDFRISLECDRETFSRLILSAMNCSPTVAADVLRATKEYFNVK